MNIFEYQFWKRTAYFWAAYEQKTWKPIVVGTHRNGEAWLKFSRDEDYLADGFEVMEKSHNPHVRKWIENYWKKLETEQRIRENVEAVLAIGGQNEDLVYSWYESDYGRIRLSRSVHNKPRSGLISDRKAVSAKRLRANANMATRRTSRRNALPR